MRARDLRMNELLSRGTNGNSGYTAGRAGLQELTHGAFGLRSAARTLGSPVGAYFAVLALVSTALAALAITSGYDLGDVWAVAALAVAAAVSERQRVTIGKDAEASISLIPILFAAVLFGPVAGMLVAAVSNLGAFCPPYMKWAVYTCSHAITGAIAGFVAAAASGLASNQLLGYVAATGLAAFAAEVSETAFFGLTMRMRGKDVMSSVRTIGPVAFASVLLYAPLVALLVAV